MVEIRSALNGTAIHHEGYGTSGSDFRFNVSVVFDPQRSVPVARGSNNQGEVWEDLVEVLLRESRTTEPLTDYFSQQGSGSSFSCPVF